MKRVVIAILLACCAGALPAVAATRFPWAFGMTAPEVMAVEAYAPYTTFGNGDVETYKGPYDGHEENIQFFFDEQGKLRRIGVYLYEGPDVEAASVKWLDAYRALDREFGAIETPGMDATDLSSAERADAFSAHARDALSTTGKIQMRPAKQPGDASVFASFMRRDLAGAPVYLVIVYFDRPRAPMASTNPP